MFEAKVVCEKVTKACVVVEVKVCKVVVEKVVVVVVVVGEGVVSVDDVLVVVSV